LFIMGNARSDSSRTYVGAMAACGDRTVCRRAWGSCGRSSSARNGAQLYVSNFYEVLTLYRQGGINFLGVFQNAVAQIESRYGKEVARIWKKGGGAYALSRPCRMTRRCVRLNIARAAPASWCGASMCRAAKSPGPATILVEQARPLLQAEDIRALTGGELGLLEAR
jgi:type IV secretion system protein VirD4